MKVQDPILTTVPGQRRDLNDSSSASLPFVQPGNVYLLWSVVYSTYTVGCVWCKNKMPGSRGSPGGSVG